MKTKYTIKELQDEQPEVCVSCGKPMDETEHNYGTDDSLCCIHCYDLAQTETQ